MRVAVRRAAEILFEAAARLRDGQRPLNFLRPGRPQDLLKAFSFGSFAEYGAQHGNELPLD
jgi:hypothetical protein